jgi:hypothetical protein
MSCCKESRLAASIRADFRHESVKIANGVALKNRLQSVDRRKSVRGRSPGQIDVAGRVDGDAKVWASLTPFGDRWVPVCCIA